MAADLALSGQMPVDRGAADAEGLGDLGGALAAGPARPGRRQLVRVVLGLVLNCAVLWTTVHLDAVVLARQLKAQG